jgi:hypothetical protein
VTEPYSPFDRERRPGPPRRYEDRYARFRQVAAALIAFSGGLAIMFLFFAAIGAVDLGEAVGLVIAVAVLALIWLVGAWLRRRAGESTERVTRADRERRGF